MKVKNKSGKITPAEALKLWAQAGGRCEYPGCNEYLLQDRLTGKAFNFGEMAHNVGRKKTVVSPRGMNSLSVAERSKAENHLLLCAKHHKLIDTAKFLEFYTPEELHRYKEEHESRIKYLTALNDTRKSVVLRMMNRIQGDSVSISNEEIVEALWKCANRYPEYLLKTHNNVEIDLSDMPDTRDVAYWKTAINRIDEVIELQLKPHVRKLINHMSIFALAPIPLLIYLGSRLGDKIRMDIYQKQHNIEEDWVWCKGSKSESFSYKKYQEKKDGTKVAIMLSVSGSINIDSVPKDVRDNYSIYQLIPKNGSPNRDLIQNKQTLLNFKKTYQQLLREIEAKYSTAKQLLIFPATPISVSILCGRGLLKAVTPKPVIYELINKEFHKAITVK